MQIQKLLTLSLFLVGTSTYAQTASEIQNDIFKCRNHFNTIITPGNQDVAKADAYCKTVMTSAVFCAEQELLKTMAKTSLTQDQMNALRPQYKYKCASNPTASGTASLNSVQSAQVTQAQAAQAAQVQQAQAAAAAQAAAQQNQATAAQGQQDKQQGLQQTAQLLGAIAPVIGKVETAYDKAAAAQDKTQPVSAPAASATAPTQQQRSSAAASDGPPQSSTSGATNVSVTDADRAALAAKGGSSAQERSAAMVAEERQVTGSVSSKLDKSSDGATTQMPGSKLDKASDGTTTQTIDIGNGQTATQTVAPNGEITEVTVSPEVGANAANTATQTAEAMPNHSFEVKEALPGLSESADKVSSTGGADKAAAPESELTQASKAGSAQFTSQMKAISGEIASAINQDFQSASQYCASLTVGYAACANSNMAKAQRLQGELKALDGQISAYITGAKENCTATGEKASFLCLEGRSPGMVAAKELVNNAGPILGALSSAQKACSGTARVTQLAGTALSLANALCTTAKLTCDGMCLAAKASLTKLTAEIKKVSASAKTPEPAPYSFTSAAVLKISPLIEKEKLPATAGSTGFIQAKCGANIVDIIKTAANVANLMVAKKAADECDKKLSTAGVAGGGATVAQYCEQPANASTQFCSCQKEPNKEGCPGFTASASTVDKENKDQKGLDLKGVGGKALFAGSGNKGFDPATGLPKSGLSDSDQSGENSQLSLSGSGSGTTFGGGAGGNSAGAGAGSGAASSSNPPVEKEKKKWDFGSFASSLFGGSGGGSKGKSATNGNLNSKQKDAIERKIASDKLSREVSSASGKSNWEKIRQAYLIKENTLLTGQ